MHRYRMCFAKQGDLKFISHLDLQRTVIRAINRAGLPAAYSQGFSPQPRLVFAAPLALGIEGKNEFLELDLTEPLPPEQLRKRLQEQFPAGLDIKSVSEADPGGPSLASRVGAAVYEVHLSGVPADLEVRIEKMKSCETIVVSRPGKKGEKKVDIRPFIFNIYLDKIENSGKMVMLLATGNRGGARPGEVLQQLRLSELKFPPLICRTALLVFREGEMFPLENE